MKFVRAAWSPLKECMALFLRHAAPSSPVFADRADYSVIEDGQVVGRIYEDLYTPPDLRWFWYYGLPC
jgi:hypothetical protein